MSHCPPSQQAAMLAHAINAMHRAYAPYSKFLVGACVLGEDGQLYSGCNVENASYPVGVCAETTALGLMITQGIQRYTAAVVVNATDKVCAPCGACRQRLREFANGDVTIYLATEKNGIEKSYTIDELLPDSFGPDNLV